MKIGVARVVFHTNRIPLAFDDHSDRAIFAINGRTPPGHGHSHGTSSRPLVDELDQCFTVLFAHAVTDVRDLQRALDRRTSSSSSCLRLTSATASILSRLILMLIDIGGSIVQHCGL